MKKSIFTLTFCLFALLGFAQTALDAGLAQDNGSIEFEVKRIYPYLSVAEADLTEATTLADLNTRYKPEWVKEYILVELSASRNGKWQMATSQSGVLSQAQKELLQEADVNEEVKVKVRYLPNNTLKHNDVKELNFTFSIEPTQKAYFMGGLDELRTYLQKSAIDKISTGVFDGKKVALVKFTITETGAISDAHIFESSKDEGTDELLLEAICNMAKWKAATYENGTPTKQVFSFTVGNLNSCTINLLTVGD